VAFAVAAASMVIAAVLGWFCSLEPFYSAPTSLSVPTYLLGPALIGSVVARLFGVVLVLLWVYRAAANVEALGRPGLTRSPAWCVGWFFVPLANFVVPYRIVRQIGVLSDSTGHWSARVVGVWWAVWLLDTPFEALALASASSYRGAQIAMLTALLHAAVAITFLRIAGHVSRGQTTLLSGARRAE
jgi:hypothetical protein